MKKKLSTVMSLFNATVTTSDGLENLDNSGEDTAFVPSEHYVTNEERDAFLVAVDICLAFIVANVGLVCNIIIIVVFAKQGYKESMNISMTAIAIWDLLKCVGGSLQGFAGPISLFSPAASESWNNISLACLDTFITVCTYVSAAMAAYVAVERCLCVSMPLLVKVLLTPKTTFIAMSVMSFVVFGSFACVFSIYEIGWIHSAEYNETIAIYQYSKFYYQHSSVLMAYYNWSGGVWPVASFFIIIVSTIIIVVQLKKASKFRSSAKSDGKDTISTRDRQVVKMLVVIVLVYVVNIFPRVIVYIARYFVYDLYYFRKYHNLFAIICNTILFFDLCNAAANLFVFVTMSSNFKATAKEMFSCGKKEVPA